MSRLATQLRQLSSSLPSGNASGAAGSGSRGSHSLSSAVHHPSLLFSPRVAADLDTESCHALALSGLTALSARHAGFAVFSSSLFHPATVRLDRRAAKPEVQAALSRSIAAFLSRLSAFFLLPAAQQCLEYCVRVYAVHELDAEAVLEMMLPYHDSLPFSRLLALLHIPPSLQRFRFLQPLQRGSSTSAVPRSVLLSACLHEPELFLRIAQSSRAQPHSAQLGLYVSLGVELLQRDDVSDALLSSLLPLLMDGLNVAAHRQPDYQAASVLLLTALTRRTALQEEVMLAVLRALLSSLSRDTPSLRSTVCLLQSLCVSQQLSRLPPAVLLLCCPHAKSLSSEIRSLMAERDCDALIVLLLSSSAVALVQPAVSAAQASESQPAGNAQSLLPFFRLLLQSLPVTSRHLLPALDAAFDAAVQTAAAARKEATGHQLPARVIALLKEILAAAEAASEQDVEQWLQQQSKKHRQRQSNDQQQQQQEDDSQGRKRRRKGEVSTEGDSEEAEDEEKAAQEPPQPDGRDGEEATGGAKKRRRHRDRRAVVSLPGASAASALLSELTRGSRHAMAAQQSEEGEGGALLSLQRLQSGDEEQQKRALTALQRLQREQRLQADPSLVEAAVLDCLRYGRSSVVLRLLSLSELLLSLPAASLQPQLTRLLVEYSASAAADSRSIVSSVISFLSTQLLPAHPELVTSFLPPLLHLSWMRAEQPSLSLSHRVRLLLPELQRLCPPSAAYRPLLQDLPLPEADAASADSSLAVAEDNERLVEAMASNALRDASDGSVQTLILVMDDALQPQWISCLTLLRVFELRRERREAKQAAARGGSGDQHAEDAADLQLLHRLFAAVLRVYGQLPASAVSSPASPPPSDSSALSVSSFCSASDSAWPAVLRFFLDRLLACCPRLPHAAARELFIGVVSAGPSLQPQLSTLLHRHVSASASSAVAFLTPLVVPPPSASSSSSRLPVAAQVASLQLLCGLTPAAETATVVPLLLSAASSSSRAVRLVAVRAAVSCGDSAAYSSLLSKLSAAAAECVTDAAYCQQLLRSGLSSSSSASRSLMQAAIATQHLPLRLSLLSLLQDCSAPELFHLAAPLLSSLLSAASASSSSPSSPPAASDDQQLSLSVLSLLMRRLTAETAGSSAEAAERVSSLLLCALSSPLPGPSLLALDQLMQNVALLPALPSSLHSEVQQAVIALGLSSSASAVRLRASEAVRRLHIPSSAFIDRLTAAVSDGGVEAVVQALTPVLEMMTAEQADMASATPLLLQRLMSALSRLSQPEPGSRSENDALLYCRQLLLTAARQAADALRQQAATGRMQKEELNLDLPLLVSLLQPPPSPSPSALAARNAAIALLPSVAALLPSGALQAVSAQLLQHLFAQPVADEQLLIRCLEAVVPSLLPPPSPSSPASLPALAWPLLSAAVDSVALTASSAASVLQLLSSLVRTVSPQSLYAAIALLLRRLREQQQGKGEKKQPEGLDVSQFISALLSEFRAEEQLEALQALLSLTLQTASSAPMSSLSAAAEALGMDGWSDADALRWQEAALRLVSEQLQSLPFVSLLLDLAAEQQTAVNAAFSRLLLQLIAHHHRLSQLSGAAATAASPLLTALSAALHRLMELQTVDGLVALSQQLLLTVREDVEEKATQRAAVLELLQDRLAAMAAAVNHHKQLELDALTAVAAPLQSMIDSSSSSSVSASRDVLRACQLSVSCLQTLLTLACGSQLASPSPQQISSLVSRRERLLPAFDSVLRLLQLPRVAASAPLTASCLVCVASGIDGLQLSVLSRLPQFVPAALSVLSRGSAGPTVDAAALSVLSSSVQQLSRFLAPQLPAILSAFMQPRFHRPDADALCRQTIADCVKELTLLLPAESLLPLLRSAYRAAVSTGSAASLLFVLSLLAQVVAQLSASGFSSNLPAVFRLYLRAFELRQRRPDFEQLDSVETELIASFLTFVLRMTEAQLKTCWLQLQDWLLQSESASSSASAAGGSSSPSLSPSRQLLFFKLAAALSGRLQSIFVPHFLQSFEQAVDALTAAAEQTDAEDASMQQQLMVAVLQSLRLSLSQDSAHLYGKDHLQLLLPSLLLSLPAAAARLDSSSFHSFVSSSFVPLCSQLALSLSQLRLWQPLHLGVLSLTRRSQAAEVRAAAWQTVSQLFTDVGSRYLVLLPETLPFIAEAQEDEETEVEDRLRETVSVIESMTGEKIDRYIT